MLRTLAKRYSRPVPRYTSYPTAAQFTPAIGSDTSRTWLAALKPEAVLSLYVHIPFCRHLCWFCGCHTTVVNHPEPVRAYLDLLEKEAALVGGITQARQVSHVAWGGGSPNILEPMEIQRLAAALRTRFFLQPGAEFSVELDPRGLTPVQIQAFAAAGVTRASLGVQDFDPAVQKAINRVQSFDLTRTAVLALRAAGIGAINIDLVYGLPQQTRAAIAATAEMVLALEPDRIALFGYAHLPERLRRQRPLDASSLPDAAERLGQANRAARIFTAHGYVPVGIDHFAKPGDPLAKGPIRRNFQGYTTDRAEILIGLGASAISRYPQGYAQNAADVPVYRTAIEGGRLPTARGVAFTSDDRVRAFVIERLMCGYGFSRRELLAKFGPAALAVLEEAEHLIEADQDGLVARTEDGFRVTPLGRPFLRTLASVFDSYFEAGAGRHSAGV